MCGDCVVLQQLIITFRYIGSVVLVGKVKSKAPLLQFKGRIVYSKSEEEVDAAAHELWEVVRAKKKVASGDVPIGFDMEWKASFQRGEQSKP